MTLVSSAALAIWVVAPRLGVKTVGTKGLIFWKDICSFQNAGDYSGAVVRVTPAEASAQIGAHCHVLANICDQKYERLRWAIRTAAGAFFLTVLSVVL